MIPEHTHDFSNGNCECGEPAPAAHTHVYDQKDEDGNNVCKCGVKEPAAHVHDFSNGDCVCGTAKPADHTHTYDQDDGQGNKSCICGAAEPVDGEDEVVHVHDFGENGDQACKCGQAAPAAHVHDFGENGTTDCKCGEKAPAVHEHDFGENGDQECKCGQAAPEKHTHSFVNGECKCGQTITEAQCPGGTGHGDILKGETCGQCGYAGTKITEANCPDKGNHGKILKGDSCNSCGYVGTHEHSYKDGVCECGAEEPKVCDHDNLADGETCPVCKTYTKPADNLNGQQEVPVMDVAAVGAVEGEVGAPGKGAEASDVLDDEDKKELSAEDGEDNDTLIEEDGEDGVKQDAEDDLGDAA